MFGSQLKYGGGPEEIRNLLDEFSTLIGDFEQHLDMGEATGPSVSELKSKLLEAMVGLTVALRQHQ